MSVAGAKGTDHCERGDRCVRYDPKTGKAEKLSIYNRDNVCNHCQKADRDEEFHAHQRGFAGKYEYLRYKGNPHKARLMALKRRCVAQMLGKPGDFREAVEEVRARWRVDAPAELPPDAEGILYPPGLRYVQFHAKDREILYPPCGEDPRAECEAGCTACVNRRRLWQNDLMWILLHGVSDKHLKSWVPSVDASGDAHADYPPVPRQLIPWYKFAAACVLFDVPRTEEAARFADYGGLPTPTKSENEEEPTIRVLSPSEVRNRELVRLEQGALDEFVSRKMWELRSELGELDYDQARHEALRRYLSEAEGECDRTRWEYELRKEIDRDPASYYVEFVPGEHRDQDVLNALKTIRRKEGVEGDAGPKPGEPRDDLLPVLCAVLLEQGYRSELLGDWLQRSMKTAEDLGRRGQRDLESKG